MRAKKTFILAIVLVAVGFLAGCDWILGTGLGGQDGGRIVDHRHSNVAGLLAADVASAKDKLRVAYWHTSHGSQLTEGMQGMDEFFGGLGLYAGLDITENGGDLGNPDRDAFEATTRAWLAEHPETNVVMWSWCGQVSGSLESDIVNYLTRMGRLEADFPGVRFVYMTGHSDGSGTEGNLHVRNQQIRAHCAANGKYLFDFYDIECYDPDGTYYGDRHVTDGCCYDADGSGETECEGDPDTPLGGDANWALDWQAAHPGEWWPSGAAHSAPLNANMKAMAAWQLFARLAKSL